MSPAARPRLFWQMSAGEPHIPYDGVPFMSIGQNTELPCVRYGGRRKKVRGRGRERERSREGGRVGNRGENIMLQNHGIMLCFDANIISLLCSTKQIIMLHK